MVRSQCLQPVCIVDCAAILTRSRAGCNFSAISGTDENALKWDKLGYAHLTKLASQQPEESFVQRTPSTELWDEKVPKDKIRHMSDYLEDASHQPPAEDGRTYKSTDI